jgi:hypothetical protein
VRIPSFQKDFLDNSSGGSFTHKSIEEAWELIDLISENTGNWDLDKGNVICLDYGYDCVKNFYTSDTFEELSNLYSLDSHVLLEGVKSFAKHIVVPKEGFIEYVKPMRYPTIMPAHIPMPKEKKFLSIKANGTNDFIETPPHPNKVQENLLSYISKKSAKRKCTSYEKIEMKPNYYILCYWDFFLS